MGYFILQIAVDRAAPQDEMVNSPYLKSSGAASATGGAGGPIRGSNVSLPGSGYAGIQGSLDFNTGVCHYIQGMLSATVFHFFGLGIESFKHSRQKSVDQNSIYGLELHICF